MGFCEYGTKCPYNHESFENDQELNDFIKMNYEFLKEMEKKNGKTCLGNYLVEYTKQKEKQNQI